MLKKIFWKYVKFYIHNVLFGLENNENHITVFNLKIVGS